MEGPGAQARRKRQCDTRHSSWSLSTSTRSWSMALKRMIVAEMLPRNVDITVQARVHVGDPTGGRFESGDAVWRCGELVIVLIQPSLIG